jgi:hypothetical protein
MSILINLVNKFFIYIFKNSFSRIKPFNILDFTCLVILSLKVKRFGFEAKINIF